MPIRVQGASSAAGVARRRDQIIATSTAVVVLVDAARFLRDAREAAAVQGVQRDGYKSRSACAANTERSCSSGVAMRTLHVQVRMQSGSSAVAWRQGALRFVLGSPEEADVQTRGRLRQAGYESRCACRAAHAPLQRWRYWGGNVSVRTRYRGAEVSAMTTRRTDCASTSWRTIRSATRRLVGAVRVHGVRRGAAVLALLRRQG